MTATQPLYIIHHNGDMWSPKPNTGRILGTFSTLALAISSIAPHTRTPATYAQPGVLEYVVASTHYKDYYDTLLMS
jgi:hypothetical protein